VEIQLIISAAAERGNAQAQRLPLLAIIHPIPHMPQVGSNRARSKLGSNQRFGTQDDTS